MRNLSGLDRSVRLLLGISILVVFFQMDSNWRYLGLLGVFPILTAALGTCLVYRWLGISTYRGSKGAQRQ